MFPHHHHPNHKTFAAIDRLGQTGPVTPLAVNWEDENSIWTTDIEGSILDSAEENPNVSTRQIATELNVVQIAVWRALHEQLL
jgi:hypothetical protein